MNKEELALHFLQEYYNIPAHWEDYKTVENAIQENKQLKEQLETSEKARKDAIKYVKKTSGYDNPYNDTFLNTYAVDNLLEILDKGE